jgi:glycine cleavage system aminomethyltransferase T
VTSLADSPRVGKIGLAILDAAAASDGVTVEAGGNAATVDVLSVLDPQKQRPRG